MYSPDSSTIQLRRLLTARVPERRFRQLSLLSVISLVALIGSGGWVRLPDLAHRGPDPSGAT